MIGFCLFLAWLACILLAFASNRDAMSPAKYYFGTCLVFFGGIFFNEKTPLEINACYLGMLGAGVALVFLERRVFRARGSGSRASSPNVRTLSPKTALVPAVAPSLKGRNSKGINWRMDLIVWLLSLIPILAMWELVRTFGSQIDLGDAISQRVMLFRGYGYLTITLSLLPPLNAAYYVLCLSRTQASGIMWLGWGAHVLLSLGVQLLTGSRTSILNILLFLVLVSHYCWRRFSLQFYAVLAIGLVVAASFLGTVRNTMKIEGANVDLRLERAEEIVDNAILSDGLRPLEVLFDSPIRSLQFGMTFLTLFTNPIPRNWWPGKPDTGGVVYTKVYLEDQWDGYSNATPGLLGESMMNFGHAVGLLFGFGALLGLQFWLGKWYVRLMVLRGRGEFNINYGLSVICFLCAVQFVNGLLTGEFTNCAVGFLARVLLILGVGTLWRSRMIGTNQVRERRRFPLTSKPAAAIVAEERGQEVLRTPT